MSNINNYTYNNLDENPYNDLLERSEGIVGDAVSSSESYEGSGSEGGDDLVTPSQDKPVNPEGEIDGKSLKNLWIQSWIKSLSYKPKTVGFYLDGKSGYAEFTKLYVGSGGIIGGKLDIPDEISANSWHVDALGLMYSGANVANKATAPVRLNPTGEMTLGDPTGVHLQLSGPNAKIKSSDYVSGIAGSGFSLDADLLEVGNIASRGLIRTAVFQKDVVSAVGGNLAVLDADLLAVTMSALDAGTMTIDGNTTFSVGDFLRIKDGTDDEWFEVTNVASAPTYVVTRDKAGDYGADTNPAWTKGASVINYKQSGDGGIFMTASESNAPYMSVFTHAGAPWTAQTTRLRVGNLNGYLGYATDLYGIAIGEATKYLKYDPTNGLRIAGEITSTSGTIGGWTLGTNSLSAGSGTTEVGLDSTVTGDNDVRIYAGSSTPAEAPFRVYEDGSVVADSVTIKGLKVFDAIVDSTGAGDYVDVQSALDDSNYNIFIKDGTYKLAENIEIINDGVTLTGQSRDNVIFASPQNWPEFIDQDVKTAVYSVTNTAGDTWRYTWDGIGADPEISDYKAGNVVYIQGQAEVDGGFDSDNEGYFMITGVGTDYWEVENTSGVAQSSASVGAASDSYFIRLHHDTLGWTDTEWAIADQGSDVWRYTYTGTGMDPMISEGELKVGDYVLMDKGQNQVNGGNFLVTAVDTDNDWFEVENPLGSASTEVFTSRSYKYHHYLGISDTQWDISYEAKDQWRYTYDGTGTDPEVEGKVKVGDIMECRGGGFANENVGDFLVVAVGTDYFVVRNTGGAAETNAINSTGWVAIKNEFFGTRTTQWDITNPSGDTWRYTYDGTGDDPHIEERIEVGMEIDLTNGTFAANNNDVQPVSAVGTDYFEVVKSAGTVESDKITGYEPIYVKWAKRISDNGGGIEATIRNIKFTNMGIKDRGATDAGWGWTIDGCWFDGSSSDFFRAVSGRTDSGIRVSSSNVTIKNNKFSIYNFAIQSRSFGAYNNITIRDNKMESGTGQYTSFINMQGLNIGGDSSTTWTISDEGGGTFRYTWSGGTDPFVNSTWEEYDCWFLGEGFSSYNRGIFEITNSLATGGVGVEYYEVVNPGGTAESDKAIGAGWMENIGRSTDLISQPGGSRNWNVSNNYVYRIVWASGTNPWSNEPTIRFIGTDSTFNNNRFNVAVGGDNNSEAKHVWAIGGGITIANNQFKGGGKTVTIADKGRCIITGNRFTDFARGIWHETRGNSVLLNRGHSIISNNIFINTEDTQDGEGIYIYDLVNNLDQNLIITGNSFYDMRRAIYTTTKNNLVISNNIANNMADVAYRLQACDNMVLQGNIATNSNQGFYLNNCDLLTMHGNISTANNTGADSITGITNTKPATVGDQNILQ